MSFLDDLLPLLQSKMDAETRKELYRSDPVLWMNDMLGVQLWSKQKEIAYSVRDHRNTAVAAGHSVGKSYLASLLMCWWIDVHPPGQTKVLSTAPTYAQVSGILWDLARGWHIESRRRHAEYLRRLSIGADLGEYKYNDHALPGYITSGDVWKSHEGLELGIGRKPPDNLLDSAFQGVHAPFLLVIGDEGAGLPAELVDALGNNATGTQNRQLIIANPTDPTSRMADFWKKNNPDWHLMNISVMDSPTITGEDFPYGEEDGMSGWAYVEEKKRDWGEDDPRYLSRVLGQWAFDAGNGLFTEDDLAKAANTVVLPDPDAKPRHGWDVARSGKDFTVGYRCFEGEVWEVDEVGTPVKGTGRRGLHVRRIDFWSRAPLVGDDPDNPGSATRINRSALAEGAKFLAIDATGMGSGVVDGLRQLDFAKGAYQVFEYYASGASTDRRAFVNARAQHYFALKDQMHAEEIDLDPEDEALFDELRGQVYEYDNTGARKLESKDSMKRRGVKSPDFADALIYASFDLSPLTDGPLAGHKKGDVLAIQPSEIAFERRHRAGMPV